MPSCNSKPGARRNRRRWWWTALALAAAAACAGWLLDAAGSGSKPSGSAQRGPIRTVRVVSGPLERTIRLTGTTAPERYRGLLVPQLRGTRRGPSTALPSAARASTAAISSTPTFRPSGQTSSSSSTTAAPSSGSDASAGSATDSSTAPAAAPAVTSNSNTAAGGTSLATALNRFSTPASGGGSSSSGSSSARPPLASDADLGSTASQLPGGANGPPAIGTSTDTSGDGWHVFLQTVVPPGSHVKKGQVVAELDRQYQLVRLDDFRASVTDLENGLKTLRQTLDVEKKAHRASIEAAKADLDKARYDLKTIPVQSAIVAEQLKLAEQEAAARYQELLSEVKPKDDSASAEWRLNTLEHEHAKIELSRAERNAERMLVRAPIDGTTVMSSTWRGGEFGQIQAGDELYSGMMFVKVVDPRSMIIAATVNQADIETIRVGSAARVRFDAYPDLELPARVYSIGAMPNTGGFRISYVKEVPVVLKLEKLDPRVIPDLSVAVDVILRAEPSAVLAPLEGIFRDAPGGPACVFVENQRGWERREVEIGLANNVAAVVRSGLRPGEVIAAERPPRENR